MSAYKQLLRPLLFKQDAEEMHNRFSALGEFLGDHQTTRKLTAAVFNYETPRLKKIIDGVTFKNPVGLAAGFNYDGHFTSVLDSVGFGFHTVGTVTAKPYKGNTKPRLARLPKSKALLVNKGFKSKGAKKVAKILDKKDLKNATVGISVGSSNVPAVNSITKAIDDYLYTFNVFKNKKYAKYFELNISCPNTNMTESFLDVENLSSLIKAVEKLNIKQPIYIKMPNEKPLDTMFLLCDEALKYKCIKGFIFSNLVKSRKNKYLNKEEVKMFKNHKGNFSGKPTEKNANKLIKAARKRYGNEITIIGCGGIFNAMDAKKKLDAGADLVQLITGMIYEGPSLIKSINKELSESSF